MDWITTFEALNNIYNDGAYSNIAINNAIDNHNGCTARFVRMFVKGVIRDTYRLEYIIDILATKGVDSIKGRTKIILMMGLYAICSMNSIPDHAAVNESVKLAQIVSKGSDKFVNAMLRTFIRNKDNFIVDDSNLMVKYSYPRDLVAMLMRQYGDETPKLLEALNKPSPIFIRVNRLKNSSQDIIDYLRLNAIDASEVEGIEYSLICDNGKVVDTPGYKSGMYSIQGASSLLAIQKFHPDPFSYVLDMCAAPGGKTGAMAEIMGNKGNILACDIHEHKLDLIKSNMKRLEIDIVDTQLMDATEYNSDLDSCFDYVLADVPCSGLGVIGSKPEIKIRAKVSQYKKLVEIQEKILENAVKYAKPGGYIEYSTCTINKDENEKVIENYLSEHKNVQIIEKKSILPYNNMTGFFYCILKKAV